ncbi:MAG: sigma-70 family RNA polymerase sigma factor [Acetatifactor sp.]|nr:sigma-70 family RNA polymerase sigma factor [Acetatifactor sp.]
MAEKEYFLYIEGKRIEVTEEVYREYYRGERRERYFMEDLKRGRTVTDPETKESRYVPGREDSLERLMESGVQFAETGERMEEQTVNSLLLECAMESLTPVERELVEELYFLERTEREAGKRLGLAKTTLRRRHKEVLDKLRNLLGRHPKDF